MLASASGAAARVVIDTATQAPSVLLQGAASDADFGAPMATGDVNGDGIADLLVADPPPAGLVGSESGRVFVFLGGPAFFASPRRSATMAECLITSSVRIQVTTSGGVPATGDVDGDSIDDIAIGSPGARLGCATDCGGTWVVLGRSTWPARLDVATDAHWTFRGTGLRFGLASLADLDGDGLDDVLVRQPDTTSAAGANVGSVLCWLARDLAPGQFVDASVDMPALETFGAAAGARQVGVREVDLDDDGVAEMAVQSGALSSARAFPTGAALPAGPVLDLSDATRLAILEDPDPTQRTTLLAREDVDGDGLPDEVSSPSASDTLGRTDNGSVTIRLAAPRLSIGQSRAMGLSVADWVAHGPEDMGNGAGSMVADLTGDGLEDIALRNDADTPITSPRVLFFPVDHGACPSGRVDVDLAISPDVLAFRPLAAGDFFGTSVVVADFDGDGLADIAMGAPDADGVTPGDRHGAVAVYRGRDDWDGDGLRNADDCRPFDATSGARALDPLLTVSEPPASLAWAPQAGVTWHVISGALSELRQDRSYARASALARGLTSSAYSDPRPAPAEGDAWWYLVVAENACGFATAGGGVPSDLSPRLCSLLR